jgi:hypothetical protein
LQTTSRKPSDTLKTQGSRAVPASTTSVATTSTKPLRGLGDGQNNQSTVHPLARKTQPPQHSKTPPKRPPPVVRDKPHLAAVAKTPHTPPSVDDSTSNPRYTTFTNRIQHHQQQQRPIDDHIYMAPHQMDVSSWPTDGGSGTGAEYPYVIMSRTDSAHIYMPLALDTTDDLEGQIMHLIMLIGAAFRISFGAGMAFSVSREAKSHLFINLKWGGGTFSKPPLPPCSYTIYVEYQVPGR